MKKYYVDAINGSDSTGDGSLKYPYQTLESCPNFNQNVLVVIKYGTYALSPSFFNKIQSNVTVTIDGQGYETIVDLVGETNNWVNIGNIASTVVFNRLLFSNRKIGVTYSYGVRILPNTKMIFNNVVFFDFIIRTGDNSYPCLNNAKNSIYMNNCISVSNVNILSYTSANEFIIKNSYGKFTTSSKPTLINTIEANSNFEVTSTYELTNNDYKKLGIGVYDGEHSWYFTNFILQMNNNIYSLHDEYFDFVTEMYKPISSTDILNNGFDFYSISNIKDFTEEKIIKGIYTNLTPKMTSNVLPFPYVISASSQYDVTNYLPWKAFNGLNSMQTDCWATKSGTVNGWIQIDMGSITRINVMKLTSRNYTELKAAPKDFILQGSNDDIIFTDIQSFNETNWSQAEQRTYYLESDVSYRYYRLKITSNNGFSSYTSIGSLEYGYISHKPFTLRPIDKFDKFQIIADTNNVIKLEGIKSTKELVIASNRLRLAMADKIQFINLIGDTDGYGNIRIAYSTDNGDTWYSHNDTSQINLDCIIPRKDYNEMTETEKSQYKIAMETIYQKGMTINHLNLIDMNTIDAYAIKFAYVISRTIYQDVSELNNLSWKYNKKGFFKELKDNEYDLEVYNNRIQITSKIENPKIDIKIIT